MCGIAGIVNIDPTLPAPELDQMAQMVGVLSHRGPDEFGVYRDARAGLGHARLSIIDLSTGQQPLANEDRDTWVVFNGEIFNYLELRAELEALGHVFRTRSDTEVIVHAYEQWGADAFRRFNGQWAVALWCAATQVLTVARDPFGVRPLFVCAHRGRLYFASEAKAIFSADPSIPRAIDPIALDQAFTFWANLAPASGFAGIEEVPAGSVVTYRRGQVSRTMCYTPAFPADNAGEFDGSLDDAVDAVRAALEGATSLRMLRADVPVGSYLSGGLDSSLVAALGLAAKKSQFRTFSLRFADAEYDEGDYQRLMSQRLGSEHFETVVTRGDIARVFPDVIAHTERPILRTAPAPLFLLSRLVRDAGIKVVLTGEGADEMFAGYDLFREAKVRRFWARQPASRWRPSLIERLYPYLQRSPVRQRAMSRQFFGQDLDRAGAAGFGHLLRWKGTMALKRLLSPGVREAVGAFDPVAAFAATLPEEFDRWSSLARDQHIEVRTLLSSYLLASQGDRMLMAHSVEGRFPFLDRDVVALAESLPPAYKLKVLDEKHVLKRASRDLVPAVILQRKKQPYRAPDALALTAPEAREWLEEVASVSRLRDAGLFDPAVARQLIDKCLQRHELGQFSNTDNMGLVGVLSAQLVDHHFVRRRPHGAPVTFKTTVDRLSETVASQG